jgi:AP-3 complex subunit beta
MGVAQLYHHLAPREDVAIVTRALIRLLRSHREVQTVVLNSIASMSVNRKVQVNVANNLIFFVLTFFFSSC